jgi:nitrate/nitrite-specific signal transduction histidine kinase
MLRRPVRRPSVLLALSYAVTVAAALLAGLLAPRRTPGAVAAALVAGLVAVLAVAVLGPWLDAAAAHLRELLDARRELAVLRERGRRAAELHEDLKREVFAIAMRVGTGRELLARGESELADHVLDEAEGQVQRAQRELMALAHQTLGPALEEWVASWSRQSAIPAEVRVALASPLAADVEDELLRVAQEALTGAGRDGAQKASVELAEAGGRVTLQVSVQEVGGRTHVAARCARPVARPAPA